MAVAEVPGQVGTLNERIQKLLQIHADKRQLAMELGRWAGEAPAGERQQTAYLYRIASNLLRDRWRHEKHEESWLAGLFASRPASETDRRVDLKVDLDSMLDTLKGRERALLWLAYVEGYDHREIAEILGLAAGSVRVLLFRARRKAAAALEGHRGADAS